MTFQRFPSGPGVERIKAGPGAFRTGEHPYRGQPVGTRPPISRRSFLIGAAALAGTLLLRPHPARSQEPAKTLVGFIVPQHGDVAGEGESLIAGFELFLKEKAVTSIEVLRRDSGNQDNGTLSALAELVMKHEVHFLVSPPTLDGSEKCIHGIPPGRVILFVTNPSVSLVSGEMCIPGAFRLGANTFQSARPLAPWSLEHLGLKVFLTGSDEQRCNEEADYFAYGFEKAGGRFVDRKMVPRETGDMQPIVDAIGKAKPDFVFASFGGKAAAAFLKAYKGTAQVSGIPVVGPESLTAYPEPVTGMENLGLGVKSLTTLKDAVGFTKRVKAGTGKEISSAVRAAQGYDMASVIHRSAASPESDQEQLIKLIEGMKIEGPRGTIRFDKNHEPILDVFVQEWEKKNGELRQKVLASLGESSSLDFGCGRVGFPKKSELELQDEKTREEPAE